MRGHVEDLSTKSNTTMNDSFHKVEDPQQKLPDLQSRMCEILYKNITM